MHKGWEVVQCASSQVYEPGICLKGVGERMRQVVGRVVGEPSTCARPGTNWGMP